MHRLSFQSIATSIMLFCAVGVSALAVRRYINPTRRPPSSSVSIQNDWRKFADGGHPIGPPSAPVTIVEFSDFQCPFCRKFASYRDSLTKVGAPIRVIYRHMPTPSHRYAVGAATSSECAAEQNRFEEMHDILFTHADSFGVVSWWHLANLAGVPDSARFEQCLKGASYVRRLAADSAAASNLKVRGTPTLLIHSTRVDGVPSFDSLLSYVRRAASDTAIRR